MHRLFLTLSVVTFLAACGGNGMVPDRSAVANLTVLKAPVAANIGGRWRIPYSGGVTYLGVTLGPDGDVWMSDGDFGHTLDQFLPGGGVKKHELGYSPAELIVGPDGAFWLTTNGSTVLRVTTALKIAAYPVSEFLGGGITTGGDGNIWFVEQSRIGRLTPKGKLKEYPLTIGSQQFTTVGATGIAWGSDGHLWFGASSSSGQFIVNLDPVTGVLRTIARDDLSGGPVIAGPDGNIWHADGWTTSYKALLVRLTPDGHGTTYVGPSGFIQPGTPRGMILGPDGAFWIVTQHIVNGRNIGGGLLRYDLRKHRFSAAAAPKGYEWEWALAFDKTGRVWMSAGIQAQIFKP